MVQAQTADEKADSTQQAVDRVQLTLEWLQGQTPMTPTQMEHWDHLVCVDRISYQLLTSCCYDGLEVLVAACPALLGIPLSQNDSWHAVYSRHQHAQR